MSEVKTLIKQLRYCSTTAGTCRGCPGYHKDSGCLNQLHAEAATLIEALITTLSQSADLCELCAHYKALPLDACEDADCNCEICKADCSCARCEDGSNFVWKEE